MKMVLGIAAVFFFFNLVSPVQMYYIYDETPNVGFVGDNNKEIAVITKDSMKPIRDPPYSIRGTYSVPVKYGIGRRFPKDKVHPIDSHFKVLKTTTSKADKVTKVKVEQPVKNTEATNQPPNEQRKYLEDSSAKDIEPRTYQGMNANAMNVNALAPQNYGRDEKVLNAGIPQTKSYIKISKDNEPYIINVHKTLVTSGQKVKLNNNQYGTIRRAENEGTVEKAQQKMANLEEVNAQAKAKYDQINKKLDRRHYDARDYSNNNGVINSNGQITSMAVEATASNIMNANAMNNGNINKVNVVRTEERKETPRIGSWEETIDDMRPYALFYRINQEQNKRQSYMGSHAQHFINDDDGEIKTNKFIEQEVPSVQASVPPNTVKLRMKMKKYSNFRSH